MRLVLLVTILGCGRIDFGSRSDATDDTTTPIDAAPTFVDTFDRGISILGNGWTEKNPGTFAISSQHVIRTDYTRDYRDSLASRPVSEALADVEVSIEFTVGHLPPGYPQIHARVQSATIATPNTLDGYLLFIDGTDGTGLMTADITRQHGTSLPPPLVTFALSPPLALGNTYRLRFAVSGASPVKLDGFVELQSGTAWSTIGMVSTTDSGVTAVVQPGVVGFDAGQPEAAGYYTYDQFTYRAL
jgi:hypothetical protein